MGTFDRPELRFIKRYRVAGRDGFQKTSRVRETEEAFEELEVEDIRVCVQGHAIRTPQELGGLCNICGQMLCKVCADLFRCEIDNSCLCSAHVIQHNGHRICRSHRFIELVRFLLRSTRG